MHSSTYLRLVSLGLVLSLPFGTLFVSASFPVTQTKLNDPADLYYNASCPGVMQWWRNDKDQVAECGPGAKTGLQFSCTVKEGGGTLTIPQVNHSTKGFYSASCDGRMMSHSGQFLNPLPVESELELDAGERLKVDLHVFNPVVIMMTRLDAPDTVHLCSVDGRKYQCLPEYQSRILIIENSLILMDVVPSDSGNYTVEEKDNTPISISHVTIRGEKSSSSKNSAALETKSRDYKRIFISAVNDVQDSWIWKSGYQKGSSDGYQKGMGTGVLLVVIVALVLLVVVFVGGVLAAPWARPLMDRFVNMLRCKGSSRSNQMQNVENGRPLRSDSVSLSSE